MSRLKVTPAGKRRKTRPITRIGKKQYLRRRFLAENRLAVAGHNNDMSRDLMFREEEGATPFQHYTRAGLSMNPSITIGQNTKAKTERAMLKERLKKIKRRKLKALMLQEAKAAAEKEEEELTGKKKEKMPRALNEMESAMVCNLMLKYGTQFKRMALDVAMNPFQLTPAQLQKKCAVFLKHERSMFPDEFEEMRSKGLVADPDEIRGNALRRRPEDVTSKGDDDDDDQ